MAATCSLIPIVVGGSGVNVVCVHKNLCVQRSTSYVAGTNGRKVQRHNGTRQLDQVPGGPMAQASRRTEVPYLPSWPFRSLTLFFLGGAFWAMPPRTKPCLSRIAYLTTCTCTFQLTYAISAGFLMETLQQQSSLSYDDTSRSALASGKCPCCTPLRGCGTSLDMGRQLRSTS